MQNKYKIPKDVKTTVKGIIQGYERRKVEMEIAEAEICSVGSRNYEILPNGERVYLPSGKGNKSSLVESQSDALTKLKKSPDFQAITAVDDALKKLPLYKYPDELAKKIKEKIMESLCRKPGESKFCFAYSGIEGISEKTFYRLRNQFLYLVAKNLGFI